MCCHISFLSLIKNINCLTKQNKNSFFAKTSRTVSDIFTLNMSLYVCNYDNNVY